jgi:hypothetical protein
MAVAFAAAITPVRAINLAITTADIERALTIARDRDTVRERFHAPYIVKIDDPFVEQLEIISEFRRVVLLAEDRIRKGDRAFAYSSRLAAIAVDPWHHRVAVTARLRFHPHNAYVDVPRVDMSVDGPNAEVAKIGVLKEPTLALLDPTFPGAPVPILGAVVEGVFDAKLIGQTRRYVTVYMDGKVLLTRQLDFGSVE